MPSRGQRRKRAAEAGDQLRPFRYALVVCTDKERAISLVKELCTSALNQRRLRVIPGNDYRAGVAFPTEEAKRWLRRFLNRSQSGASEEDRVREVALILFDFHPTDGTDVAFSAAAQIGFSGESVGVFVAHTPDQLAKTLAGIGHADPVRTTLRTLEEVLRTLQEEFNDLVVADRAYVAARGYEMPRLEDVLGDMRAVHLVYGRRTDPDGRPVAARDRKAVLKELRGKVLQWESEDVIRKHRTEHVPELGETVEFPMHLEYSHNYTRIHFWFAAPEARRGDGVVTAIIHAGAHLQGARRRQ